MGDRRKQPARHWQGAVRVSDAVRHTPRAAGTACARGLSLPRLCTLWQAMVSVFYAAARRAAGQCDLSGAQPLRALMHRAAVSRLRAAVLLCVIALCLAA